MRSTYTMYDGNHQAVGFAFTTELTGRPVELSRLYVLPGSTRGKGHGRALLRAVCKDADREHKNLMIKLELEPEMDFARLITLFQEFGFKRQESSIMTRVWVQLPKVEFA